MSTTGRFDNISNTKLAFSSVVIFGALLMILSFVFGEILSGVETMRSLAYTAVAIGVGGVLLFATFTARRYLLVIYAFALLFGTEALFVATMTAQDQRHHAATARQNYKHALYVDRSKNQFSHHPVLAGMPTANYKTEDLSHTAQATRTTARPKDPDAPTIVTIGGSTTYGGTNKDRDTWASLLAERANLNVVNMGVLGYSSAEHVIQTAFWAPEYAPRCAVYYVGWNDIRSVGVNNVKPDYSSFHFKRQGMMLGVSPHALKFYKPSPMEYVAIYARYINWRRNRLDNFLSGSFPWWRDNTGAGILTSQLDEKALNYFTQNMKTIITLNQARGVRTILIPQIMNFEMLTEDDARPWTPFLSAKAVKQVIGEYNQTLIGLAQGEDVWALDNVLDQNWRDEHFVDEGHFTASGAEIFADAIADDVAAICR